MRFNQPRFVGVLFLTIGSFLIVEPAASIQLPETMPAPGTRCVYEGVFPGSGAQNTWEYIVTPGRSYRMQVPSGDMLRGILSPRLSGHTVHFLDWQLTGSERWSGPLLQAREQLTVTVQTPEQVTATVSTTVRRERVCEEMPAVAKPGDRWQCRETIDDGWTVDGPGLPQDSGSLQHQSETRYHFLRSEPYTRLDGTEIEVAIIEQRPETGPVVRNWLDPDKPWCPVKVERLQLDRVVGTDRLTAYTPPQDAVESNSPPAAPARSGELGKMASYILLGFLLVVGIAACIGWYAGVYNRRSRERS